MQKENLHISIFYFFLTDLEEEPILYAIIK